tara:strand:+ start:122 stop:370 length:249 start_codon:yes stop_codon:yes gene_type:complete
MNYNINININTDSAAFDETYPEVERILKHVKNWAALKVANNTILDGQTVSEETRLKNTVPAERSFNDHNGNAVCTVTINRSK